MIDTITTTLVSNAVTATLLAVVAWIVTRRVQRPVVAYTCWSLVLIKLITPPIWTVPIEWPVLSMPARKPAPPHSAIDVGLASAAAVRPAPSVTGIPAERHSDTLGRAEQHSDTLRGIVPENRVVEETMVWLVVPVGADEAHRSDPTERAGEAEREPSERLSSSGLIAASFAGNRWAWLAGIWLTGIIAIGGLLLTRSWRFMRLLRAASPAPESLRREVDRVARSIGLARSPVVRVVSGRLPPMIWFVAWRPVLILPASLIEAIGRPQRTTLIAHELAHLRRRDHWMRLLELVVTTLYWWHPVAWWARAQLRQAEEARCDAFVIMRFPKLKRAYLEAILDVIDFLAGAFPPIPALASGFGRAAIPLQRRLEMMVRKDTTRPLPWVGRLLLAAMALAWLPFAVTLADEPGDKKTKQVETQEVTKSVTVDISQDEKAATIKEYVIRLAGLMADDDDGDDDDDDKPAPKRRARDRKKDGPQHDRKPPRSDRPGDRERPRYERGRGGPGPDGRRGDRHEERHTFQFHVDGKRLPPGMPEEARKRIEAAMRGRGGPGPRPRIVVMTQMDKMGREAGRIGHLEAARQHLHQAGLHELAERVEAELREAREAMERRGHREEHERAERERREHRGPEHAERGRRGGDRPERGRPGDRAERGRGGPPPGPPGPPPEVRERIERMRAEMEKRRDEMERAMKARGGEIGKVLRELQRELRELREEVEELKGGRRR